MKEEAAGSPWPPAYWLASLFGAGRAPFAPGTFGSLAAFPLAALAMLDWRWGLGLLVLTVLLGVPAAAEVARARRDNDPGEVVIDEAAGMIIAALGPPVGFTHLWIAFFAFRFFDVLKPWPCRRLERLPGGWGIVADDLMAGVYALIATQLTLIFLNRFA